MRRRVGMQVITNIGIGAAIDDDVLHLTRHQGVPQPRLDTLQRAQQPWEIVANHRDDGQQWRSLRVVIHGKDYGHTQGYFRMG